MVSSIKNYSLDLCWVWTSLFDMNSSHCTTNCWELFWLADERPDKLMNANRENKENVSVWPSDSLDSPLHWKSMKITWKAFQTSSWYREPNKLINSKTSIWNSDDSILDMLIFRLVWKNVGKLSSMHKNIKTLWKLL